jgi:hypothetical protein
MTKPEKQCPHWSDSKRACGACTGGLFIPPEDHITTFCTTSLRPNCPRYRQETASQSSCRQRDTTAERRRSHRLHKKVPVKLILLNSAGNIVYHLTSAADTVDLSTGGMQVSVDEPLGDDAFISFSFGKICTDVLQSSIGRVKWCRYRNDTHKYAAGLAFQTEHTSKAIGTCLGLNLN